MTAALTIAVPAPLYQTFTYLPLTDTLPEPGCRVIVPFGRQRLVAMVLAHTDTPKNPSFKLKKISEVIDDTPLVSQQWITLWQWLSDYYCYPIGESIFNILPKWLRQGRPRYETTYALTADGIAIALEKTPCRAPRQRALCAAIHAHEPPQLSASALRTHGFTRQQLNSTLAKAWLKPTKQCIELINTDTPILAQPQLVATPTQQKIIDQVNTHDDFHVHLLAGITGSGKTEVYLQCITKILTQQKQALVLIPEISLTPQTLSRFTQRFNRPVACRHSQLTDREQFHAWQQAQEKTASVLVGTRSALFTPMPNLGLIIIDEEHDASYKQQSGLRYHARDVAIKLAKQLNIPILLGSATPTIESWHNAQSKRFHLHTLRERANQSQLPSIHLVKHQCANATLIADEIHQAIEKSLNRQHQVLIFLNRRGYAAATLCPHCGWVAQCKRCDMNLTFHQTQPTLRCHHCDYHTQLPRVCPSCQQATPKKIGMGTQQIEMYCQQHFPDTPLMRFDRDTTARRGALEALLKQAHQDQPPILLGTQMLAKGHHFPNIRLVVILNADQHLFSTDFRAQEHLGQLILQVSGRAGREKNAAHVLIQTQQPEHPLWATILTHHYPDLANQCLSERQRHCLPPFSYQALICAESTQPQAALDWLRQWRQLYQQQGGIEHSLAGPFPAPIERLSNRYRAHLWCQTTSRSARHQAIHHLLSITKTHKTPKSLRWSIDIDPIDIL